MRQVTREALSDIVDAIVREIKPECIILFGSRARGESRPESDVDLLIIESEPFGPKRSRWEEVSRIWNLVARFRAPVRSGVQPR